MRSTSNLLIRKSFFLVLILVSCFLIAAQLIPQAQTLQAAGYLQQRVDPQGVRPKPSPSPTPQSKSQKAAKIEKNVGEIKDLLFGRKAKRDLLAKKGPQFPSGFTMNDFSIEGFVKGNWPVVVEYELESEATALITVEFKGIRPFTYEIKGTKQGESRQEIFHLPPEFPDKPEAATISIKALESPNVQKKPFFRLYALGMGDEAVGSVAINQLNFRPGSTPQRYLYEFRSLRDFNKWAADFMKVTLTSDGELLPRRVKTRAWNESITRGTQVTKDWDGRDDDGQISEGRYKVQVRVWRSLGGGRGGDWVARISTQDVIIR